MAKDPDAANDKAAPAAKAPAELVATPAAPKKPAPAAAKPQTKVRTSPKKVVAKRAAPKPESKPKPKQSAPAVKPVAAKKSSPATTNQPKESIMSTKNPFEALAANAAKIQQDRFEMVARASAIMAEHCQKMAEEAARMAQEATENHTSHLHRALEAQTLNAWAQLTRESMESSAAQFVSGATRLSEMGVAALAETAEPVAEHVRKTMERAGSAANT